MYDAPGIMQQCAFRWAGGSCWAATSSGSMHSWRSRGPAVWALCGWRVQFGGQPPPALYLLYSSAEEAAAASGLCLVLCALELLECTTYLIFVCVYSFVCAHVFSFQPLALVRLIPRASCRCLAAVLRAVQRQQLARGKFWGVPV